MASKAGALAAWEHARELAEKISAAEEAKARSQEEADAAHHEEAHSSTDEAEGAVEPGWPTMESAKERLKHVVGQIDGAHEDTESNRQLAPSACERLKHILGEADEQAVEGAMHHAHTPFDAARERLHQVTGQVQGGFEVLWEDTAELGRQATLGVHHMVDKVSDAFKGATDAVISHLPALGGGETEQQEQDQREPDNTLVHLQESAEKAMHETEVAAGKVGSMVQSATEAVKRHLPASLGGTSDDMHSSEKAPRGVSGELTHVAGKAER